ncbi:MAG: protein TolQ [Gemmatimonadetes bacterium]|nr:protein TolQ [Gemmatimonadota bacterium]
MSVALWLSLRQAAAVPHTTLDLITQASLPTKVVLAILAVLSLASWAIMFAKWVEFRGLAARARFIVSEFERVSRLEQAAALAKRSQASPYTGLIERAVWFVTETKPIGAGGSGAERHTLTAAQVESLHLILDAECTAQRDRFGRFVPSLAIIGSASPLLGLFGTVLGVISAFTGIMEKGSGNLSAVAPGVAEALTATAAALAVAVPAVFAYNLFASKLNRLDGELEGFSAEIIALLAREGRL